MFVVFKSFVLLLFLLNVFSSFGMKWYAASGCLCVALAWYSTNMVKMPQRTFLKVPVLYLHLKPEASSQYSQQERFLSCFLQPGRFLCWFSILAGLWAWFLITVSKLTEDDGRKTEGDFSNRWRHKRSGVWKPLRCRVFVGRHLHVSGPAKQDLTVGCFFFGLVCFLFCFFTVRASKISLTKWYIFRAESLLLKTEDFNYCRQRTLHFDLICRVYWAVL